MGKSESRWGSKRRAELGERWSGRGNTGNVESRSRVLGGWGGGRGAEREIEKEGFTWIWGHEGQEWYQEPQPKLPGGCRKVRGLGTNQRHVWGMGLTRGRGTRV